MNQTFRFGEAVMHFARARGPRGFIWKYTVCYLLGALVMAGLVYALFQPVFTVWFDVVIEAAGGASESEVEAILVRRLTEILGRIIFSYILILLLALVFWAMFEAAIQRRYVREEGFGLRIGSDELRLLVVGLMWGVFTIICYVLTFLVAGLVGGLAFSFSDDRALFGLVFAPLIIAAGLVWMWLAIRLSPAAAMTIRDRKIQFFGAWGATRGRAFSMFGAYVVLGIMLWLVMLVAYFIGAGAIFGSVMANLPALEEAVEENPLEMMSLLMSASIIGPFAFAYFLMLLVQGLVFYVWAGPASLAAKTDPRGGGVAQAPDIFT